MSSFTIVHRFASDRLRATLRATLATCLLDEPRAVPLRRREDRFLRRVVVDFRLRRIDEIAMFLFKNAGSQLGGGCGA